MKANLFFEYFCELIGSQQASSVSFDLQSVFGQPILTQQDDASMTQAWTQEDVKWAITSWKSNKSPGPNGFTGEFYNTFLDILLPDIYEVFSLTNKQPAATLHPLNDSHIVLIPKKEAPTQPQDFRPISLINGIQKLYSKIMARKLKPLLDRLLTPSQTGFLKSRSILHGFFYAQQVIQAAAKQGVQIAVFKADIFKAFDTLQWPFLLNSLKARGFPNDWIECVHNKVLMGQSRVIVNSVAGRTIKLKRGVRQGDPLSPLLFNLSIDFLSRWITKLNDLNFLIPPFPQCKTCLQYADDTLLLLKPTRNQIVKVRILFEIFGQLSGLKINSQKSELVVTSSALPYIRSLAQLIHCSPQTFPIKYLGLPLSDKSLSKADFLPLIDRVQSKLAGWRASLLSIGGRFILTNAVLSAMPQYYMSVFLLPKWVVKRIDQIRRRFLWHGHKEQSRQAKGIYMVNWATAIRPRKLGGLGIRDIQAANYALLMKWLWKWHDHTNNWWKKATPTHDPSDKPWDDANASNFWKKVRQVVPVFVSSVMYQIGNGDTIKLWHDNWSGAALKTLWPNLYLAAHQKHISIAHYREIEGDSLLFAALTPELQIQKAQLMDFLQSSVLSSSDVHSQDAIVWLRDSKAFSVGSAYRFLTHTHPAQILDWQMFGR